MASRIAMMSDSAAPFGPRGVHTQHGGEAVAVLFRDEQRIAADHQILATAWGSLSPYGSGGRRFEYFRPAAVDQE
jgi:hypothetical protein